MKVEGLEKIVKSQIFSPGNKTMKMLEFIS